MQDEWKVHIQRRSDVIGLDLIVWRKTRTGATEVYGDPVRTFTEGELIKPTLFLEFGLIEILGKAIAEFGVKQTDQSFVEGNLEAVKEHLEDMRELVFKGKQIKISGTNVKDHAA